MNYMIVDQHNTQLWEGKADSENEAWSKMFDEYKYPNNTEAKNIELSKWTGMRIIEVK